MAHNRAGRVGDLIKKEIATLVLFGDIKDPRIGLVTISGVKMTSDLKHARVFFTMMGSPEDVKKSLEGLNSARGYIRRVLAKNLKLKNIPDVVFEFDESFEYADHIEKVIKNIKEEGRS